MAGPAPLYTPGSLMGRLVAANAGAWNAYTGHAFVRAMADASLPDAAFRHYLVQDYLFLIHFARAWGLAAYKSRSLADIRAAAGQMNAILDEELNLHVEFCKGWGLSAAELERAEEDTATLAYTRYVLERGLAGDLLDLHVALAPCIVGYGEIGRSLAADSDTRLEGNPYAAWIDMYAGSDYQEVAHAAVATLDRLGQAAGAMDDGAGSRFRDLSRTFAEATRLEAAFWQMGLDAAA